MKVVVIPTNRPVARKDLPDEIYAHKKINMLHWYVK